MVLFEEKEDLRLEKKVNEYRDCLEMRESFRRERVNLTVL